MKTAILLAALTLIPFLSSPARAQEGWLIPFAAAYRPNIGGFRDAFGRSDNNLPLPAENQFGWGLEIRSLTNGFLIGPLYSRTWADAESDSWQLRSQSDAIFGTFGYKIAPARWLSIVPMLGIGGLSQSLNLRSRTGDLPLEELLRDPGREVTIRTGLKLAGLAALELGLAYPTATGSYGITTRLGYFYSPVAPDWHLANGARLTNAPTSGNRGPFLTVGLLILPAPQVSTTRQ